MLDLLQPLRSANLPAPEYLKKAQLTQARGHHREAAAWYRRAVALDASLVAPALASARQSRDLREICATLHEALKKPATLQGADASRYRFELGLAKAARGKYEAANNDLRLWLGPTPGVTRTPLVALLGVASGSERRPASILFESSLVSKGIAARATFDFVDLCGRNAMSKARQQVGAGACLNALKIGICEFSGSDPFLSKQWHRFDGGNYADFIARRHLLSDLLPDNPDAVPVISMGYLRNIPLSCAPGFLNLLRLASKAGDARAAAAILAALRPDDDAAIIGPILPWLGRDALACDDAYAATFKDAVMRKPESFVRSLLEEGGGRHVDLLREVLAANSDAAASEKLWHALGQKFLADPAREDVLAAYLQCFSQHDKDSRAARRLLLTYDNPPAALIAVLLKHGADLSAIAQTLCHRAFVHKNAHAARLLHRAGLAKPAELSAMVKRFFDASSPAPGAIPAGTAGASR